MVTESYGALVNPMEKCYNTVNTLILLGPIILLLGKNLSEAIKK